MLFECINGLRAPCTQSFDEMNKKRGMQWEAARSLILPAGGTAYSVFKVGTKPVDLKQRILSFTGAGVIASIYRAPTYTGGTLDEGVYNMNTQFAPNTALSKIYVNPTVTNLGVKRGADIIMLGATSPSAKGQPPIAAFASNRILETETTFLLTITSLDTAAQTVAARLEFYEGELDYPNTDFSVIQ